MRLRVAVELRGKRGREVEAIARFKSSQRVKSRQLRKNSTSLTCICIYLFVEVNNASLDCCGGGRKGDGRRRNALAFWRRGVHTRESSLYASPQKSARDPRMPHAADEVNACSTASRATLHTGTSYTLARLAPHLRLPHRPALLLHARGVNENQAHSLTHMPEAPLEKFVLID